MSVNLRYGHDREKTKHLGNVFSTIDFEVDSSNKAMLETRKKNTNAGTLHIAGREFKLTLAELEHLIETCQIAKQTFFQKYRLGL